VKTASLNGEHQEEVFVKQAPGFTIEGQEHKVFKLHKVVRFTSSPSCLESKIR
jgi:hypothetical protein